MKQLLPVLLAVLLAPGFANAKPKNGNPAGPVSNADIEQWKRELSGTFWTFPWGDKVSPDRSWFSLNADGTASVGWHNMAGSWKVIGNLTIQISITGGEIRKGASHLLRFNPELTQAAETVKRINPPTQAMLDKVAAGFAPITPGGGASSPPAASDENDFGAPGAGAAPASSALQESASKIVKANHNNLVFVTGKEGSGSGFIASMGGANFLVTNAHVAAGINGASFKALDGSAVQGGAASVAVGEDIFRMEMPAGGKPLEAMEGVDENAGIGDEVVVLGNAEGAGVINTIMGKIVGMGPNLVEISAPFVPGNSGSPIIHIKSGKVIGVATYAVTRKYDATTKEKVKAPVIRRFGYRIDTVKKWQAVNWRTFYAQATEMQNIEALTKDLDDFFRDIAEHKGGVTPGRHTNPVIKTRIEQWLADKSRHLSGSDAARTDANFISFLKIACRSDVTDAQRQMTYDYFQRDLADEQATRNEMAKGFEEIVKAIRQ